MQSESIAIDFGMFLMAFQRDRDYHNAFPNSTYLDKLSGNVLSVYENDGDAHMESGIPEAENRKLAMKVRSNPDRYLCISGLSHGDHHAILQDFLDSAWTDDGAERQRAINAYAKRSIGQWMKDVGNPATVDAYEAFRSQRLEQLAEEFLRKNGFASR